MVDKIDSDSFKREINKNPFMHAGYRGIVRRYNNTLPIPEQKNVPFLTTVVFPFILLFYMLGMWLIGVIKRKSIICETYDHIISVTSTSNYRTYPMTKVGSELRKEGKNVLFICSPSAEPNLDNLIQIAPTVTYKQLHTQISVKYIYYIFCHSLDTIVELKKIICSDELTIRDFVFAFNLTLLEYLEYYTMVDITGDSTHFHSMKVTSGIISCVPKDQVYVYQHGLMIGGTTNREYPGIKAEETFELSRNVNCYRPLTYFVWGDRFHSLYRKYAHPDSQIVITGSPWLDHLNSHSNKPSEKKIDVLFISQSYGYADCDEYEDLVNTITSICESNNLNFAIKLHPTETGEYYDERGLSQFIGEFKDIDDALKCSKIAITDTSTSFLEASIVNTPIIVTDVLKSGLHEWSSTSNVVFFNNSGQLEEKILLLLDQPEKRTNADRLVKIGDSVSDICDIVYSDSDDRLR